MGALRPGAGHPVKRREDTVDTEEVRFCWKQAHMHTLAQLSKLDFAYSKEKERTKERTNKRKKKTYFCPIYIYYEK